MVIQLQADMWNFDGAAASHISQYRQFIDLIAAGTGAFGKPVLLFNGDTHVYRSDNPLSPGAACVVEPSSGAAAVGCTSATVSSAYGNADASLNQPGVYNVANFRRVTVHGSTTPLDWLNSRSSGRQRAQRPRRLRSLQLEADQALRQPCAGTFANAPAS